MTTIIKSLEDWGWLFGKKFKDVDDFYNQLHVNTHKISDDVGNFAISLVRTDCILGLLLVANFYKDGKAIRHLQCTADDNPYANARAKKIHDQIDPSGIRFNNYQKELERRRQPLFSFSKYALTFKVENDWEPDDGIFPRSKGGWGRNVQSVTEEQFLGMMNAMSEGRENIFDKWIDLDWEEWGK